MTRSACPRALLVSRLSISLIAALLSAPALAAVPPAETVLPAEAVAMVSIADSDALREKWRATQIGQFSDDESLKPFVEQMREKLVEKFGDIRGRLGMTIDDVTSAAGGEVAIAMLYDKKERASVAVVIDATGKANEAEALIAKSEQALAERGATKSTVQHGGATLTVLSLAQTEKRKVARDVVHFRQGEMLVAVDSLAMAKRIVDTVAAGPEVGLLTVKEYDEVMSRCRKEADGLAPDVQWFAALFRWDEARRSLQPAADLADRKDTITILKEQGFDAIRGVGGVVNVASTPERDFVHRTAIYAPPKPGTEGKPAKEKYDLGMRMAELPNRSGMKVEPWAPRMVATYTTVNLDILNAFDHVASVFDAMSGYEGAFQHTLDSFEVDPYGPQIKVRDQLVIPLGSRVTMMTDYTMPITTDCERYLVVLEVRKTATLQAAIDKLMKNDGAVRKVEKGIPYWEIVPEDETLTTADIDDDLRELDSIDDIGPAEGDGAEADRQRLVQRAAVCLNGGHLIIASDVEFLRTVLFGVDPRESLAASFDFRATMKQLDDLAPAERCSWSFLRTDESIRPSYELIRQGLMPQSQTFFGRFLNELLTTKEDEQQGIVRKQRVDGSRLPTFELARRYFGPSARAIRTDDDGWMVTGVILSKAGQ